MQILGCYPSPTELESEGGVTGAVIISPEDSDTHRSMKGVTIKVEESRSLSELRARGRVSRRPLSLVWAILEGQMGRI